MAKYDNLIDCRKLIKMNEQTLYYASVSFWNAFVNGTVSREMRPRKLVYVNSDWTESRFQWFGLLICTEDLSHTVLYIPRCSSWTTRWGWSVCLIFGTVGSLTTRNRTYKGKNVCKIWCYDTSRLGSLNLTVSSTMFHSSEIAEITQFQ